MDTAEPTVYRLLDAYEAAVAREYELAVRWALAVRENRWADAEALGLELRYRRINTEDCRAAAHLAIAGGR